RPVTPESALGRNAVRQKNVRVAENSPGASGSTVRNCRDALGSINCPAGCLVMATGAPAVGGIGLPQPASRRKPAAIHAVLIRDATIRTGHVHTPAASFPKPGAAPQHFRASTDWLR